MAYQEGSIVETDEGTFELKNNQWVPAKSQAPAVTAAGKITPEEYRKATGLMRGLDESALAIGSGIIAEPAAGIAGLMSAPFVGAEKAGDILGKTREMLSYKPRTQAGVQSMQNIGKGFGNVMKGVNYPISYAAGAADLLFGEGLGQAKKTMQSVQDIGLGATAGQQALQAGASPAMAAAYETTPAALAEFAGLKGLQKLRGKTTLLDEAGDPTKAFRRALDKRGLSYDDLTPQAKQAIPSEVKPGLIPGADVPAQGAERAIINQIKSGGRSDALAGLSVVDDVLIPDLIGKEAVRQGFRPGIVQSVKTSSQATKTKMKRMVDMMRRFKKSERSGLDFRPSDVVGDSVTDRIKFIRDKAAGARKDLNMIAQTKLAGKTIDAQPIVNKLQQSLDDLDIKLATNRSGGVPQPIFKGSLISKDRTSQRVIKDLIDLLSEGGTPDALRAHKLKRQLDIMIDFNKKSAAGLTDAGRNVLKDMRRSLNDAVRHVDPEYAKVNDILSQSLNSLDSLDDAVGSIDVFGLNANKALGTRMRALLSNQQGRIKIENAVNSLDDVVVNLGGKFDDSIKDLVMFSDALDDRFGTVAKTSFSGQIEQATRQAVDQGVTRSAIRKAADIAGKGTEKMRGVSELNAFESMVDLLNK